MSDDIALPTSTPNGYWLHQFTARGVGRMTYAILTGMKPGEVGQVVQSNLFGNRWFPYEKSDVWVWSPIEGWGRPGYYGTVESRLRREKSYAKQ